MAKVTLYALANYNSGELVPKTFDLDLYTDWDSYREAVSEWISAIPDPNDPDRMEEEWILADVEDIPSEFHGEFDITPQAIEYNHYLQTIKCPDYKEAFEIWVANNYWEGLDLNDFNETYLGQFGTKVDAVHAALEGDNLLQQISGQHTIQIDWDATFDNLGLHEERDHVFRQD